jgi:hypothetical protein
MERITIRNSSNIIIEENTAPDLQAWLDAITPSLPAGYTIQRVNIDTEIALKNAVSGLKASRTFGVELVDAFAVENVALGIDATNSDNVLNKMDKVLQALQSGYLETAIRKTKQLNQNEFDGVYLSAPRLLGYVNKIEAYLGLPISTEL